MSIYMIFSPPKTGVKSFLWKINQFGEIVVEHVDEKAAGIVASGREMCVVGSVENMPQLARAMNLALDKIPDCEMRLVAMPRIYQYGVRDEDELITRLNAKGNNAAKALMSALPSELRYKGVVFNDDTMQWQKKAIQS